LRRQTNPDLSPRGIDKKTISPTIVLLRESCGFGSQLAPLLEVIARPNHWDRQPARQRHSATADYSENSRFRPEVWTHFCNRHPTFEKPAAESSMWVALPGTDGMIAQYIARKAVGIFVRPPRGSAMEDKDRELARWLQRLSDELGL
jgi:hypothetical protein